MHAESFTQSLEQSEHLAVWIRTDREKGGKSRKRREHVQTGFSLFLYNIQTCLSS